MPRTSADNHFVPQTALKADDISKRGKEKALRDHKTRLLWVFYYLFVSVMRWTMRTPRDRAHLPREIILLTAENLNPRDQLSLLHAVPDLVRDLTFRHTSVQDEKGDKTLLLLAEEAEGRLKELLLAKNGTQVDPKNKNGRTPLSYAAGCGYEEAVKLLVERNDVKADSEDDDGLTPLLLAAECGYREVVKLLLWRGDVEADSKDSYGLTPLSLAAMCGHEEVVKLLVERNDVRADLKDEYGLTPLALARTEAVLELLNSLS
jgi:ankyrin repeat protein